MTRVKLGDHEYEVRLRASAWPYLHALARSFTENPPTPEELERAEYLVLKTCVRPEPCEEHASQLLTRILVEFVREMRSVSETFREEGPDRA